jgi:hypothetical protein
MELRNPALDRARAHVKHLRDFFYHLVVFLFVNGLLVVLDVRAGTGANPVLGLDWAYWVILFWGVGLVAHAIWAFFDDYRVQKVYEKEQLRELAIKFDE